jgi:hypothetical protein
MIRARVRAAPAFLAWATRSLDTIDRSAPLLGQRRRAAVTTYQSERPPS